MCSLSRPEFQLAPDSDIEGLLESDEIYRLLFSRMLNGVAFCKMLFDDDGQPYDYVNLKVNHMFAALTGLKDIEGKRITEIMPDFRKSQSAQFDAYARVAQCGQPEQFETYVQPLQRWFLISVYSPRHGYFVVVFDDITERKKAEEELRLASLVYQASSEAMTVTDASGTILAVNPAFTTLTGYALEEVMGKTPRLLKSGHHGRDFYAAMWHDLNTKGQWQGEIWNRRKNGEIYPEWLSINSTFNEDGSVHRRVALFSDITKKKQLEELLWQQANIDLLTGLPNRRMFLDRMEQEIRKAEQSGSPLALLFLDLDYFKDINDTLGHGQGDLLLREVALRLESCVRRPDMVARLGGDEFTIVVPGAANREMVDGLAQDILRQLAAPFQLGENQAYVTASMGITIYPADAREPEDLLNNADQAMYAAKMNGRNRCQYFTQSLRDAAQARMRLINDLRVAIKGGQFRLVYQPIVELSTGIVHKAEALIRWHHPALGPISPSDFIPVAEEIGMIVEIGDWVFRQAVSQARRMRALYAPDFQISVNKSPVQFLNDERLYKSWLDHLDDMKLPGDALVIEITESSLMDGAGIVIDKLNAFRHAGMQLSLDDFGTGYSSISYLKKFDFDYLKIDQSFVRNLTPDSDDMALCDAIIAMAHKLGIKVVAEGVETEEQRTLLTGAGCDYAQGYLFSRPVPAEELEKLLQAGQIAAPSIASTCDLQV